MFKHRISVVTALTDTRRRDVSHTPGNVCSPSLLIVGENNDFLRETDRISHSLLLKHDVDRKRLERAAIPANIPQSNVAGMNNQR